ncbi:uL30 family ribosomal protein [Candidatus Woesearchaeota archaeon]|nr:uL30 family ribosomal protein [Candidatus Woesearchaeota archaeon]MBI2581786.1 uL30 family ribosomal protein [Candidatus Woesearchaeota archaeon]
MAPQEKTGKGKLAVVLVRGMVKVVQPVKETLAMLNLHRKNHCVVIENTSTYQGMLFKVKDYVTWGEIDDGTFQELVQKRGQLLEGRGKALEVNGKKYKRYFALNSPRKGFDRKGIKDPFSKGGTLGYRGEKMKDLLKRML